MLNATQATAEAGIMQTTQNAARRYFVSPAARSHSNSQVTRRAQITQKMMSMGMVMRVGDVYR